MRLTIAYSEIKKRNVVLINNDTYQRETASERPIRQPLITYIGHFDIIEVAFLIYLNNLSGGHPSTIYA